MISIDPSSSPPNNAAPPRALHNRSEQWIFGRTLRHTPPSWPADMHIIRGTGLVSSETWSWRAPVARRAGSQSRTARIGRSPVECVGGNWIANAARA